MASVDADAERIVEEEAAAAPTTLREDIMAVKGLYIEQQIELLEVLTGFETENRYKVKKFQRDG